MSKGYLVFENGTVFTGELHGDPKPVCGEAVFNTSMNGYQEVITDPSYAGQILVFTYPQIGNYGFGDYGFESKKPALQGLVVKEMSTVTGHYESKWSFNEFIKKFNLNCLSGVDTRAIARMIRMKGSMGAVMTGTMDSMEMLKEQAAKGKSLLDSDLVKRVSRDSIEVVGEGKRNIVLWDFGTKNGIIRSLLRRGCKVTIVPAETKADTILSYKPDGVVLSNGPGNPESCDYAIRELKKLTGKIPIFGICLGHQLLALAMGASTYKLTFGHRGGNHTVKDTSGKCFISSQNHGYAVDAKSLTGTGLKVNFINLNDNTVEGLCHEKLPLMSVQFHPEATPGPQDTGYLFDRFLALTA
ncbi:MAG TPA: glutamine-hydrolyzing carbamoyl-phosphate synthase small subunit [Syntrophomonadaceae bacterium]|nr:glutamine-hydrolyzing carbamoyl-phosphate synthase small subunit [Syntrophomonadaceae bacterium]